MFVKKNYQLNLIGVTIPKIIKILLLTLLMELCLPITLEFLQEKQFALKVIMMVSYYFKAHRLKKSVEENIWGSYHNLEEEYLPHCTYHRRSLGEILKGRGELNRRDANPAFGALSPRLNKLHSLAL